MLTKTEIALIEWAVKEAKAWAGGQPTLEGQEDYRFRIKIAEDAVKKLKKESRNV